MRKIKVFVIACFCVLINTSFHSNSQWTSLLDDKLSKWEMYLSYRHKDGYNGALPKDENGRIIKPIGYNKNIDNVFSVKNERGNPVLRISGEIYGCVFTKEDFENYHLKLKVKWGEKKWEPRINEYMDSGILYHSQGECGVDYWRSWMLSQEFQIIEKGMGDYWPIANSQIDIRVRNETEDTLRYAPEGKKISFGSGTGRGYCQVGSNREKSKGEWNELELICFEDKSIYIVNGEVVMTLSNSRYKEGSESVPLTKGRIQLQSEAAEVFFKDISIKKIERLDSKLSLYFN